MADFKDQIKKARDEREKGELKTALDMFLKINKSGIDQPNQLFDYLGELGLTYLHLKNYVKAKKCYEEALELPENLLDDSKRAVVLKHLSNPKFHKDNPDEALKNALEARELALNVGRKDLVWFDSGITSILFENKSTNEEIEKWIKISSDDMNKVGSLEKDETAKWTWFVGILIDQVKLSGSETSLNLAYFVANQFGLKRRLEQIEELKKIKYLE